MTSLRESPRRAGRYVLEVGGGVLAPVSVEMVADHGLRVGAEIDAGRLELLERDAASVACYDCALDALARRSRSRADLERWLRQREFGASAIGAAIERLTARGLLDDEAFARGFARSRLAGKGFGPRRVAAELGRRGVAQEVADRVLADLLDDDADGRDGDGDEAPTLTRVEAAAARRARSMRGLDPAVAERRLLGWLVRRGFAVGEARAAARRAVRAVPGAAG